jgi:hypothetical protein
LRFGGRGGPRGHFWGVKKTGQRLSRPPGRLTADKSASGIQ